MHTRQRLIAGAASLSALALLGLTAATTAGAQNMTLGQKVRHCVQERRDDGYFDRDATREERRALRLQFRQCIRGAVFGHGNSSSRSSMSSSMPHSSSSSSTSSMSSSSMPANSSSSSMSSMSSMSSSSLSSMSSSSMSSSSRSSSSSMPSNASIRDIDIEDFEFSPETVHIKVGRTVRWTNEDEAPHNVRSTDGGPLNSANLQYDQTYMYTFTQPGTYQYHCSLHPGMTGTIVVTD